MITFPCELVDILFPWRHTFVSHPVLKEENRNLAGLLFYQPQFRVRVIIIKLIDVAGYLIN